MNRGAHWSEGVHWSEGLTGTVTPAGIEVGFGEV